MDGFWAALKRELDERDLCYPRVLWWDEEDWPRATQAVRPPDGLAEPRGTFTNQLDDTRAGTEEILPGKMLNQIYSGIPDYEDDKDIGSDENIEFYQWFLGYSVPIRQQAVWEAMLETAKTTFPLTTWSNYDGFTAGNPEFLFPGDTWREAYNTPDEVVRGDLSAPKLYTPNNLRSCVDSPTRLVDCGTTYAQVLRNLGRARIDACVNSPGAPAQVPWFQTGLRQFDTAITAVFYDFTREDALDILTYAWMRGVDNFIIFVFDSPFGDQTPVELKKEAFDLAYDVSFELLRRVHWLAQESRARTARVSRLGR